MLDVNLCVFLARSIFFGNTNAHTCGCLHLVHTRGFTFVCDCKNFGMFVVPRRTGLMCEHLFGRSHVRFHHTEGSMCGCLAIHSHMGWCVGIYQFAHTPVFSFTLKDVGCHVFCRVHGNCPSVLISRWQLSLLSEHASCHVFCRVHGNCPSVLVSRWQLSLYPNMLFCHVSL